MEGGWRGVGGLGDASITFKFCIGLSAETDAKFECSDVEAPLVAALIELHSQHIEISIDVK